MQISNKGKQLILSLEGIALTKYYDSVVVVVLVVLSMSNGNVMIALDTLGNVRSMQK